MCDMLPRLVRFPVAMLHDFTAGYHNEWNGALKSHPNLWTVLTKIKEENRSAVRQIRGADRGMNTQLRKRK